MTEHRWPGEERLSGSEQQELGPEVSEDEVDLEPGEEELAEAEAPASEDGSMPDTPVPAAEEEAVDDEPPAEEDELPRPRGAQHAEGGISIPDGYDVVRGSADGDGDGRTIGIVISRFNGEITNRLFENALAELERLDVSRDLVTVVPVPGAFELPLGALALAKTRRVSCVIALGCVIRGETAHFDYIAGEAASGLQLAALETGIPVAFGVLTLESAEQADGRYDKGAEAVRSALEMADLFAQLRPAAGSG